MSGDPEEEYLDPHGECAAEIARLREMLMRAEMWISTKLDGKDMCRAIREVLK